MKYVKVKYVDSKTGIPANIEPCRNGPTFPKLVNLEIKFSNRADWPVEKDGDDTYWGICWNTSNTNLPGVVELSESEWLADREHETQKLSTKILGERDQVLQEYLLGGGDNSEYITLLGNIESIGGFPWDFEFPSAQDNGGITE